MGLNMKQTHGDDDHGLRGINIQAYVYDGEDAELTEMGLRRGVWEQ